MSYHKLLAELRRLLEGSDFDPSFAKCVSALLNMLLRIRYLMIHQHDLEEEWTEDQNQRQRDKSLEIHSLASSVSHALLNFQAQLRARANDVLGTLDKLPQLERLEPSELEAGVRYWLNLVPHLHQVTGSETRLFSRLAEFYDKHIKLLPYAQALMLPPISVHLHYLAHNCDSLDAYSTSCHEKIESLIDSLSNLPCNVKIDGYEFENTLQRVEDVHGRSTDKDRLDGLKRRGCAYVGEVSRDIATGDQPEGLREVDQLQDRFPIVKVWESVLGVVGVEAQGAAASDSDKAECSQATGSGVQLGMAKRRQNTV